MTNTKKLKPYLREYAKTKDLTSKTVNLTASNAKKIKELNIFLSKLVRDYLDSTDKKELLKSHSREHVRMKNEGERVTTSVTLRSDQKSKVENVNISALVNELIENL